MTGARPRLLRALDALERLYGPPADPPAKAPLDMIFWEAVGYLADDERRAKAFRALASRVGLSAEKILAAPPSVREEIAAIGGIMPELRGERLREIAGIVVERFGGKLDEVLRLPPARSRRELGRFPGIGAPGAEKILLFTGTEPLLALESNGLRVLLRLGYGKEAKSYAASYRSAQAAAEKEIEKSCAERVRAHQLLRRHGQEMCRRTKPRCELCPLTAVCAWYAHNA